MTIMAYPWTPKGRTSTKLDMKVIISDVQTLVREAAYHVACLESIPHPQDEEWSRSVNLLQALYDLLKTLAGPNEAQTFMRSTYQVVVMIHDD